MSTSSSNDPSIRPLPDWALGQAMNGRDDEDAAGVEQRAREFMHDFEDERHDDDDDPDEGGEA